MKTKLFVSILSMFILALSGICQGKNNVRIANSIRVIVEDPGTRYYGADAALPTGEKLELNGREEKDKEFLLNTPLEVHKDNLESSLFDDSSEEPNVLRPASLKFTIHADVHTAYEGYGYSAEGNSFAEFVNNSTSDTLILKITRTGTGDDTGYTWEAS